MALSIGWQTERFRREGKGMKALGDYLKSPEEKRVEGARKVRALFERKSNKKG